MGRKRGEREKPSEAKKAAAKANGSKPRGNRVRVRTDRPVSQAEYDAISDAKALGRKALPDVIRYLVAVATGTLEEDGPDGKRIRVKTGHAERISAGKELADRCGMPRLMVSELKGETPKFIVNLQGTDGPLGWPRMADGAGSGGVDDGADPDRHA